MVGDHFPELAFQDQLDGLAAEPRGEGAVEGCRSSTTLQVAENDVTGLFTGEFPELSGDPLAFPAEAFSVAAVRLLDDRRSLVPRVRPLGNDNDAEPRTERVAVANALGDALEVVR